MSTPPPTQGPDARPVPVERRRQGDRRASAARMAALEADRWRSFEDAQREADTMFAQYQLSQLLASGATVSEMAPAVLDELLRNDGAPEGALWLTPTGGGPLVLMASVGEAPEVRAEVSGPEGIPGTLPDAAAAAAWCRATGWVGVTLEESRDAGTAFEVRTVGFVALGWRPTGPSPEPPRFLPRVRHELAIAFRAAQLREALAQERAILSAILDGASDAIVAVDEHRMIVRLNRAASALLDVPPEELPAPCVDLLGCRRAVDRPGHGQRGESRPEEGQPGSRLRCGSRCPFEEVLAGAPPIVGREQTVSGHGGQEIPVVVSYARMASPGAGAVAVMHDLRAARALDELRSSFVAAVSHDLRTPLALISAYVDTLLGLDLDEAARRRSVEGIGKAATRLTALVNEILDVAHLESDRIALRRRSTPLGTLVAQVAADFADAPGMPPIELAVPEDLPAVHVDADRIAQVLSNLLTNAAKYGGVAGPIVVRARPGDRSVVVSVEDGGDGIDAAEREQVFERFYRGRRAQRGSVPGSGLGLYVCRRLVEAHGGRIWVDERESGTSISFTLPVTAAARPRRSRGAAREERP